MYTLLVIIGIVSLIGVLCWAAKEKQNGPDY